MARRRWLILMDLDDTLMPTNYRYIEASWRCGMILSRALGFKSPYPLDIARMEFEIDRELGKEYGFVMMDATKEIHPMQEDARAVLKEKIDLAAFRKRFAP